MSDKKPKREKSTDSDKKSGKSKLKKSDAEPKRSKKSTASNISQSVLNEHRSEIEDID
jgi:hypothetical protein